MKPWSHDVSSILTNIVKMQDIKPTIGVLSPKLSCISLHQLPLLHQTGEDWTPVHLNIAMGKFSLEYHCYLQPRRNGV